MASEDLAIELCKALGIETSRVTCLQLELRAGGAINVHATLIEKNCDKVMQTVKRFKLTAEEIKVS